MADSSREDTALIVSHEHRFIFLKTRKTAGTSVEIALSRVCGPDDIITPVAAPDEVIRQAWGGRGPQHHDPPQQPPIAPHMGARAVKRLVGPRVWRTYRKLSVERNPWDAVVSLYFWHYRDVGDDRPSFEDFLAGPRIHSLAAANARGYRIAGEVCVDSLMRFESLSDDLADEWAAMGLPGVADLPRAKGTSRPVGAAHHRALFAEEHAALVGEVFADLISLQGYEF